MSSKKKSAVTQEEQSDEQINEPEKVELFKNDFEAMQRESEKLAAEMAEKSVEAEKQKLRADEMTNQAQRLQAEFDNYRKRTNETNKRVKTDGNIEVLEKILPVLDAIEQAKTMIKDESTLSGIAIIDRQLNELLKGFGVEKIESIGSDFDPNLHNAVMEEEVTEEQKGKVVQVYQQGYKLGDRILRHAVVIVGK